MTNDDNITNHTNAFDTSCLRRVNFKKIRWIDNNNKTKEAKKRVVGLIQRLITSRFTHYHPLGSAFNFVYPSSFLCLRVEDINVESACIFGNIDIVCHQVLFRCVSLTSLYSIFLPCCCSFS